MPLQKRGRKIKENKKPRIDTYREYDASKKGFVRAKRRAFLQILRSTAPLREDAGGCDWKLRFSTPHPDLPSLRRAPEELRQAGYRARIAIERRIRRIESVRRTPEWAVQYLEYLRCPRCCLLATHKCLLLDEVKRPVPTDHAAGCKYS